MQAPTHGPTQESQRARNPFETQVTVAGSTYSRLVNDALELVRTGAGPPKVASRVHDALRALVLDPEYPCVGSRSALNQGSYRFAMYDELGAPESSSVLAYDLFDFVAEQDNIDGEFSTFITCFESPKVRDEEEFERLLWATLRQLHELDSAHHDWDPDVSRHTDDPRFSFSFAGRAYFVVGLSPASSRWARQFPWPTLAFNAHRQFEELRRRGEFDRIQEVVRERDRAVEGDTNPNLADFGDHTEARQYSGRAVEKQWRCPVRFG